jgi:hypothetical protein
MAENFKTKEEYPTVKANDFQKSILIMQRFPNKNYKFKDKVILRDTNAPFGNMFGHSHCKPVFLDWF